MEDNYIVDTTILIIKIPRRYKKYHPFLIAIFQNTPTVAKSIKVFL